jgi:CPA2 family monovalent cation:H+ antiporter-2
MQILTELVVVLGSAAVVTAVFQAARLPVVLGYVLAGIMIGPHMPVSLVTNVGLIEEMSQLGVILLMFTIGLELPLATFRKVGAAGALTSLFEVGLVVAAGTLVAELLGFGPASAVFAGACLGISSTMLVVKEFEALGWKGGFTRIVFAILVFEDLIAIVLLAVVTAIASGAGLDASDLARLLARLAGFLAVMLIAGLVIVPRAIRWIASRARRETLAITSLLVCFGFAALASAAGFSVALGAFVAGVLVAESGHGNTVFHLVEPFRDVFAAMFFVSIGMSIDPGVLASEGLHIAAFTAVVLLVKPHAVAAGVFVAGHGVQPAVRAGVSLAQIGEFSFVIAGISGDPALLAIAVGVSVATALVSPLLVRNSEAIARWVAGKLPPPIATFTSFYDAWIERLRARPARSRRTYRRALTVLAIDTAIVTAIIIGGATSGRRALDELGATGLVRNAILIAGIALLALPFAISIVRHVAVFAHRMAREIVPAGDAVDLGRAARRTLVATFELATGLVIAGTIAAIAQPFVPSSLAVLLAIAVVLVVLVRRTIRDFDGHVRAGSELLVKVMRRPATPRIADVLPGFNANAMIAIRAGSPAVGRTLAELDLRATTGATVLAIAREPQGIAMPAPGEPLQAGDILALAGSDDAIEAARLALGGDTTAG